MNEIETTPSRPRKKGLRLTLGALMALVLVLGCALAWIAHRARVQRDAVAAILKAGGSVAYDWEWADGMRVKDGRPRGAKWLREALGPDVFDAVASVGFSIPNGRPDDGTMAALGRLDRVEDLQFLNATAGLSPAGMAEIRSLSRLRSLLVIGTEDSSGFLAGLGGQPQLRHLHLANARATDSDLERIARTTDLEELSIDGRNLTEAGFARLSEFKNLKHLLVDRHPVRDLAPLAGMKDLERLFLGDSRVDVVPSRSPDMTPLLGLTKLAVLQMGGTPIDDANLALLASLPNLKTLAVSGGEITEAGLAHLARMPKLNVLGLSRTSVRDLAPLAPALPRIGFLSVVYSPLADDGLIPLEGATGLRRLILTGTGITDEGLDHLRPLSGLLSLRVGDTKVTEAGAARLKRAIPRLRVDFKAPAPPR